VGSWSFALKITVTADVHLRERSETPERYRALENVLEQSRTERISEVIIAGDLFDRELRNYADFEAVCRQYGELQIHVIPGNHDPGINQRSFVGENIRVYDTPETVDIDRTSFMFLPYAPASTMAQCIAEYGGRPVGDLWVLVGHGDYYGGVREPNPLEPGTYMPLTRSDVEELGMQAVLLGHIHKADQWGAVTYVGSPCGLDINETGVRHFLLFDTANGAMEQRAIDTEHIYFVESFVVMPVENEVNILQEEIERRISAWELDAGRLSKVCVRVSAAGYARDRRAVHDALANGFAAFKYYGDAGPNTDELLMATDDQLNAIAQRTREIIDELDWDFGGDEPEREDVLMAALATIYGR